MTGTNNKVVITGIEMIVLDNVYAIVGEVSGTGIGSSPVLLSHISRLIMADIINWYI